MKGVLIRRGNLDTERYHGHAHTEKRSCEDTEKAAICKPKRKVLGKKNQSYQYLDLGLPNYKTITK